MLKHKEVKKENLDMLEK
jgi:50S ribosomal subunit-associated GTPase HflX